MTKQPLVSIIICLHVVSERFFLDSKKFDELQYPNFECIIVTNKNVTVKLNRKKYRVIESPISPISLGEKRDLGVTIAKGKFIAFIDDDAYPHKEWLSTAVALFQSNPTVGIIGGPNLTPQEDPFWAKIGGYIYGSYLTSGGQQHRFVPGSQTNVMEVQGVNMIIRSEILKKLGGFRHKLYSGDDSKICAEVRGLGFTILYDPFVRVYHHRRSFPEDHLRQIRNMGTHRGFFVKAHPETISPIYFLPALLTLGLLSGVLLSIVYPFFRLPYVLVLSYFYVVGVLSVIRRAGLVSALITSFGIILTHVTYGTYFLVGFVRNGVERVE